ncbi:MAG TPA: alanine--tRNA ligase-related protein [Candidatus Sulfotelmatobacter sp.]|nr:alanine--tRNA ligase-related protein [Candidatus Sulfotelmatobacter sp.]
MTTRLYYHDSFLYDFDAEVREVANSPRPALILDRSAFYPTSGGQIHDTGWLTSASGKLRVTEVADAEDGRVVHYIEAERDFDKGSLKPGTRVRGQIDATRRRDHMQQHSGQHVLSAAFIRLFNIPTVSFHMADDYCSIDLDISDLDTPTLTKEQVESAERLANEIILENRPVNVSYVTRDEAGKLGLRKLPPTERDELRIIDIHDFDLTACGGTHVNQTGQIASVLLRKTEKVRQGWRVEFVAGQRAVATARRDFTMLSETAALFSANIYDVPTQARKALDEIKSLRKQREQSLEELAAAHAATLLAETPKQSSRKLIVRTFADRDLNFLKLLAQKVTRQAPNAIALLATTSPQPSLIFAQSAGQPHDMGALLKETMAKLGGRGGGTKDMAQGGVPSANGLEDALAQVAGKLTETPAV